MRATLRNVDSSSNSCCRRASRRPAEVNGMMATLGERYHPVESLPERPSLVGVGDRVLVGRRETLPPIIIPAPSTRIHPEFRVHGGWEGGLPGPSGSFGDFPAAKAS